MKNLLLISRRPSGKMKIWGYIPPHGKWKAYGVSFRWKLTLLSLVSTSWWSFLLLCWVPLPFSWELTAFFEALMGPWEWKILSLLSASYFIVIIVIKSIPKVISANMAFSKMTYCSSVLGNMVQLSFWCQLCEHCFHGRAFGNGTSL